MPRNYWEPKYLREERVDSCRVCFETVERGQVVCQSCKDFRDLIDTLVGELDSYEEEQHEQAEFAAKYPKVRRIY